MEILFWLSALNTHMHVLTVNSNMQFEFFTFFKTSIILHCVLIENPL